MLAHAGALTGCCCPAALSPPPQEGEVRHWVERLEQRMGSGSEEERALQLLSCALGACPVRPGNGGAPTGHPSFFFTFGPSKIVSMPLVLTQHIRWAAWGASKGAVCFNRGAVCFEGGPARLAACATTRCPTTSNAAAYLAPCSEAPSITGARLLGLRQHRPDAFAPGRKRETVTKLQDALRDKEEGVRWVWAEVRRNDKGAVDHAAMDWQPLD